MSFTASALPRLLAYQAVQGDLLYDSLGFRLIFRHRALKEIRKESFKPPANR